MNLGSVQSQLLQEAVHKQCEGDGKCNRLEEESRSMHRHVLKIEPGELASTRCKRSKTNKSKNQLQNLI